MIKHIFLLMALWPLAGLAQKTPYHIHGRVGNYDTPQRIYLEYFVEGKQVLDSCNLKNGAFSFSGKIDGPVQFAQLFIDHAGDGEIAKSKAYGFHRIIFFIEKGDILVNSPDYIDRARVTGSLSNAEYMQFRDQNASLDTAINNAWDQWHAATSIRPRDTALIRKAGRLFGPPTMKKRDLQMQYLDAHPDSYVSLLFLQEVQSVFIAEKVAPLFNKFSARVRNAQYGREVAKKLADNRVATGVAAPDFSEQDTSGKMVTLSSFRGKYVLLDFWASWCGPCRAETPNVLSVYNRFKDKNFTVLSISLDREGERAAWLAAVQHDQMSWTNLSALKYMDDAIAKTYGISAIPQNFLIDPKGIIVGRNLMGKELEAKIADLLK